MLLGSIIPLMLGPLHNVIESADFYKPVFTSIFSFLFFLFLIWILRKKSNLNFLIVIFSAILPLISLLRKGVHESGDFTINIYKSVDLWNSLSHGIFPVHWASMLNATYGYPLFTFTYPLPYYAIVLLKFSGFTFIASEKIIIATAFILSGVGMYLFVRMLLKPVNASLAAILYLFAPYHLVDMHFRVALGELLAYAALPFVFYFTLKLVRNITTLNLLLLTFSYVCLILSHQAITLITTPFILALPIFLKKETHKVLLVYFALISAILMASFYWLPLLAHLQFTHQATFSKHIGFENPFLYLASPWRYSFLYQGPTGQLSFPMGFIQVGLLVWGVILYVQGHIKRRIAFIKPAILTLLILTFMLLPIAEPIWRVTPFMTNFQFAYRLMLPISFLLALTGGAVSTTFSNKVTYSLLFLAIILTILNWSPRNFIDDITDNYLINHVPLSTFEAEGLQPAAPKWRNVENIWIQTPPRRYLESLSGQANIEVLKRTPISHVYRVDATSQTLFRENTFYFPGWNLYINGNEHPFWYTDEKKSNLVYFNLPKGQYSIELKFEQTPIIVFANWLSLISLIIYLLTIYYFLSQRRK